MISMMRKSQQPWTAPCFGPSAFVPESSVLTLPSPYSFTGDGGNGGDHPFAMVRQMYGGVARLRDGRQLQQVQDERQGWSVFCEGTTELIALTAHEGAANGGVSGPYPWRQPV
ncbi:hypothetical protein [Thermomonospora echinospora]|uniref:hypothetical protein n=1 Tax=Thermomonospora echinospora TaxID=1992 RepID=UPI000CDF2614|nr:hypothetical protein [Thermomonospora echinospora]